METFEKTLSDGFSCLNTRLYFDSEILMTNLTKKYFQKMNIDQSFKEYNRDDLKLVYKIKLDNQENYCKKRLITKISKLDENNQYGFAMTKTMPTGCIKENKPPSWLKFNLLQEVDLDVPIGHFFVVDIFFDEKNATEKKIFIMKFFHLSLKNRKLLARMNDLRIKF